MVRSEYGIVLPATAGECDHQTADELQKYLLKITGALMSVVTASEPQPAKSVRLVRTTAGSPVKLGAEAYQIRTAGDQLIIEGGGPLRRHCRDGRRQERPWEGNWSGAPF